ncbi:uncharacterized protein LOC134533105 [Bacillus rossius redtenbacheri]|uniref:uncharacterized protein LOC134533105 n=1 Tax=Bacillus rossius redtenbacheri TaxID=93214 RepID=UPI002FDCFE3F
MEENVLCESFAISDGNILSEDVGMSNCNASVCHSPPESKTDTVSAANDLLQNGILMETNKGLVCLSLKDVLSTDVGGLKLSMEDFQNVAVQLLSQHGGTVCATGSESTPGNIFLSISPGSIADMDECLPLEVVLDVKEPGQLRSVCKRQPPKGARAKPAAARQAGQGPSPAPASAPSQQKRRGGWPKGRKRKPQLEEMHPPKAPATGYVLFLNEKRRNYKDLPFPEVTKLLGNEWSKLSLDDKKVYLEQAEVEKKRYREELRAYRQSDAYQAFLNRKRAKHLQGNGTEESDMDATDEIEDEDNEELYCRTCDQWFSSLHNKKEHLYGRQHLQSIAGDFSKKGQAGEQEGGSSTHSMSTSLDESSMDGTVFSGGGQCRGARCRPPEAAPDMEAALSRVMATYQGREREIRVLSGERERLETENSALARRADGLKGRVAGLLEGLEGERRRGGELEQQQFDLLARLASLLCPAPSALS